MIHLTFTGPNLSSKVCHNFDQLVNSVSKLVFVGYFNTVSEALEIKTRIDSLNEKITYAAEVQSTLRELLVEVGIPSIAQRFSLTGVS